MVPWLLNVPAGVASGSRSTQSVTVAVAGPLLSTATVPKPWFQPPGFETKKPDSITIFVFRVTTLLLNRTYGSILSVIPVGSHTIGSLVEVGSLILANRQITGSFALVIDPLVVVYHGFGTVAVDNNGPATASVTLCVDILPDATTAGTFNNHGTIEVGVTTGLYNRWL